MKTRESLVNIIMVVFFIAIVISDIFIVYYSTSETSTSETSTYINLLLVNITSFAALIAFYQLKVNEKILKNSQNEILINHEWNKQQLTMLEAKKGRESIKEAIRLLQEKINFNERHNPYTTNEIHDFICEKGYTLNDNKNLAKMNKDGIEIKHAIMDILNYYEFLAIGINIGIFDKNTIKKALKTIMSRAFFIFEEYIYHLRGDRHNRKTAFIELEQIVKEWKKEDEENSKVEPNNILNNIMNKS
ncbi:DUF4760 domain-containing protein [Aliarcobacter butzleri]|uniref:DUF4760 domain-containing protein n=1 Tax=Aliarcobacter butzleri TaxID=28197 RepID=UPI0021B3EC71|nr:DUF4760 domain-containing protein [Aliarcobacter butzleri]MCT7596422.1 DUF4760 domain-containing protein [Aliarcobacter butzleri]